MRIASISITLISQQYIQYIIAIYAIISQQYTVLEFDIQQCMQGAWILYKKKKLLADFFAHYSFFSDFKAAWTKLYVFKFCLTEKKKKWFLQCCAVSLKWNEQNYIHIKEKMVKYPTLMYRTSELFCLSISVLT